MLYLGMGFLIAVKVCGNTS